MFPMTPRRAFWHGFATVGIPSVIVCGLILRLLIASTRPNEWPLCLLFVAMLLPVLILIYSDERKGPQLAKADSRKSHLAIAILLATCSALATVDVRDYSRGSWRFWCGLAGAGAFLAICVRELYCAAKARGNHEAEARPPIAPKEL